MARNLIPPVEKLANGEGITFQFWPSGTVFAQGERIDINSYTQLWELLYFSNRLAISSVSTVL
jgi:hypothetical protein